MSEQHDDLQCEVDRLLYDFNKRTGRLYMPKGDRCDMHACVQMFMAIDRHVKRIETFSGGRPLEKWIACSAEALLDKLASK